MGGLGDGSESGKTREINNFYFHIHCILVYYVRFESEGRHRCGKTGSIPVESRGGEERFDSFLQ
jgi:hypothetical protein